MTLLVATLLIEIDRLVAIERFIGADWFTTTATAARAMLSAIAGSLVSVTGVVFSITMLTLAQTSSQYGSRLLRTVLKNNVTQVTLGVFLSTAVFSFAVLKSVREPENGVAEFVPHISTFMAMLMGLFSLIVFIYFVHHVSTAIQAQTIVRTVFHEFEDAINRLYPTVDSGEDSHVPDDLSDINAKKSLKNCYARSAGYLQGIDTETLVALADRYELLIRSEIHPGEFSPKGGLLCSIVLCEQLTEITDAVLDEIAACFITGVQRTPRQDIICSINELAEVAIRALSPGINDPFTAISCIDYLSSGLAMLVQRQPTSPLIRNRSGRLRLVLQAVCLEEIFGAAFHQIRLYGASDPEVLIHLSVALNRVAHQTRSEQSLTVITQHCNMLARVNEARTTELLRQNQVTEQIQKCRETIADQLSRSGS